MRLLFISVFIFHSLFVGAQAQAIKMKHYYWNNPLHNFNTVLTENGRALLDSIKLVTGLDTLKCKKVKYADITTYTNRKFLSAYSYKYLEYTLYNGKLQKNYYQKFNGYDSSTLQQCILSFSTNYNNIDIVSLYILN